MHEVIEYDGYSQFEIKILSEFNIEIINQSITTIKKKFL